MNVSYLIAMGIGLAPQEVPADVFSHAEELAVIQRWAEPNRLRVEDANPQAPHKAAYSPAASAWFLAFYKRRNPYQAVLPNRLPEPTGQRDRAWDAWIDKQYVSDKVWAGEVAAGINSGVETHRERPVFEVPSDLGSLVGAPPAFFEVVRPKRWSVNLPGFVGAYTESVEVPEKFPYYRSNQGVKSAGSPTSDAMVSNLLRMANVRQALRWAVQAVSSLEGSFGSVNTYDSGSVSVGWLQFAALPSGRGSLANVLARTKRKDRSGFQTYFRDWGIDVTDSGVLTVFDPTSNSERTGSDAVKAIVSDKRLVAVLQRAGSSYLQFQREQVACLADDYDPGKRTFTVQTKFGPMSGRVGDVIKSEAGLATLLDRLVNRGNIEPFSRVVADVMAEHGLRTISEVAKFEFLVVDKLSYRQTFLASARLAQPPRLDGRLVRGSRVFAGEIDTTSVAPLDPKSIGALVPVEGAPSGGGPGSAGSETVASRTGKAPPVDPGPQRLPPPETVAPTGTPKVPTGPITAAGG